MGTANGAIYKLDINLLNELQLHVYNYIKTVSLTIK